MEPGLLNYLAVDDDNEQARAALAEQGFEIRLESFGRRSVICPMCATRWEVEDEGRCPWTFRHILRALAARREQ